DNADNIGAIDTRISNSLELTVRDGGEAARAKAIIDAASTEIPWGGNRSLAREVVLALLPLIETVEREARLRSDDRTARRLRNVLWLAGGEDAIRETAVCGALMSAMARLDLGEIEALLGLWPNQPHDAASNLRHAGALREIGKIREAYLEIFSTVTRLR